MEDVAHRSANFGGLPRPVILLVDDEPDILIGFGQLLEALLNATIVTAGSGKEALDVMQRSHVDLVVSDYRMPFMNGVDFLAQAKEFAPDVPRVLLTAYPDAQVERAANQIAGCQRFLSKAIAPEDLVNELRGLLQHATRATRRPPGPGPIPEDDGGLGRKKDHEGRTLTGAWTLAPYAPAVKFHQTFGHVQPQTGPGLRRIHP